MDDPFASLTSGFGINKTSMKDSKLHQQAGKPASKPPAPQWQRSDARAASPYGSPSHGQQQQSQQQPFHNRYPSPVTSRTHSGDTAAAMRSSNSGGSLNSLENLANLGLGSTTKNQPMKRSPMSMGGQSSAVASAPAPSPAAAQSPGSHPKPEAAPMHISSDDFDSVFGGSSHKAPAQGVVGVDVFGGGVPPPSAAQPAAPSGDPFDMFGDIGGTAVNHSPPAPAESPATHAHSHHSQPQPRSVSASLIPGFSGDLSAVAQAAQEEMAAFSVTEEATNEAPPPPYEAPPPPYEAPPQSYEDPEAPPSYEDVLGQARMPPTRASVPEPTDEQVMAGGNSLQYAPEGTGANASGRGNRLSRKKSGAMEAQAGSGGASSLFGKLGKEGNKLGGLLMKHGAKAAQQAQKAVSQGVAQVREVVNENMHRPQSSEWRQGPDGPVMDGEASPSAVHIKMAETLLSVDESTRDAMLSAMEPEQRASVERLLAEFESPTKVTASKSAELAQPSSGGPGSVPAQAAYAEASPPAAQAPVPPSPAAQTKVPEAPAPPEPEPEPEPEVDFLFSDTPSPAGASSPAPTAAAPTGLEEFLNPAQPVASSVPVNSESMFGGIFGDEPAARTGSGAKVQVAVEKHAGDTAERAALRAARAARVQQRIDQQLRARLEMDDREEGERQEQSDLKASIAADVNAWKKNSSGNIVALLASLQNVLWEGSGWTPIGMGDLLSDAGVKKGWRKANLLVHPDKVKQKGGDTARVVRADMIFDQLKLAYQNYKPMGN